jgi:hypothetical protein
VPHGGRSPLRSRRRWTLREPGLSARSGAGRAERKQEWGDLRASDAGQGLRRGADFLLAKQDTGCQRPAETWLIPPRACGVRSRRYPSLPIALEPLADNPRTAAATLKERMQARWAPCSQPRTSWSCAPGRFSTAPAVARPFPASHGANVVRARSSTERSPSPCASLYRRMPTMPTTASKGPGQRPVLVVAVCRPRADHCRPRDGR